MRAFFLLISCFILNSISHAQSRFTVYYAKSLHDEQVNRKLESLGSFKNYRLITQHYIDPKNTGQIDLELLRKKILDFYPSADVKELICLDLENKIYNDLIKYDKSDKRFLKAQDSFISMVKLINGIRPNLKIGIYAIPSRYYYKSSKEFNSKKFDEILKHCDVIMPSLYSMYPEKQVGKNSNTTYLKNNLRQALEYGVRLNKPVIPFVWSMVHPSNKLYSYQILPEKEMKENLEIIKNYTYNGSSVDGIVWWETNEKIFKNWYNLRYNKQPSSRLQDDIILNYLNSIK